MTKEEALKTYYGYDAFRGGQEAVIDALLSGRDALAIMPTGAGKSVCYQIPALLLPGITLVVSPLVSLMRDQVTQLVQMGIPAAFLNSSLTFRQYLLALDRAREGRYKIIYVAPERLETEGFQSFVREADICHWRDYHGLRFLQCACRFTEQNTFCRPDGSSDSKRREIKELIARLKETNPYVEGNIFKSVENVNLRTIISWKRDGERHSFLDDYDR